ncbi:MAG TPA: FHA domain-containing protein [Candidatus Methylomirabilis sp.]|nr:FHA domain-containing protein [Candidatus Methylomirabilis sp.]
MSAPRFPACGAPVAPPGSRYQGFDEMYRSLLGAGRTASGYFVLGLGEEARYLFVLGGLPYGAGRAQGDRLGSTPIGDFFGAYAAHPTAPLLFCPADAFLIHGLLVLFGSRPSVQVTSDLVDVQGVLERLAARGVSTVLALRQGERIHLALCPAGRPARTYFVPDGADLPADEDAQDSLLAFVYTRQGGQAMALDVYEGLEVPPAADACLVNPPPGRRWTQHYRPATIAPAASPATPASTPMPQAEVTVMLGDRILQTVPLGKARFTIGRAPGNDLVIENAGVSRLHAVIRFEGQGFVLEDQRSANGTFLNRERVTTQALRDGNEIGILKHRLIFRCGAAREVEAAAPGRPSPPVTVHVGTRELERLLGKGPAAGARLLVPGREPVLLGGAPVTIGSGEEATVRVAGLLVKRVHARITREADGRFRLTHLGGLSPTKVNGERVAEQLLRDGDVIAIGGMEFTVRLAEGVAATDRPARA